MEDSFTAVRGWFWDDSSSPDGASGKETACQCRRYKRLEFDPWVGKVPLEEGTTTHSRILAWRIPWTEELAHRVAKSQT